MDNSVSENTLSNKSSEFARRIIQLYRHLQTEQKEYVLSKQILWCGTSIGANIAKANQARSNADFIGKLFIALGEAIETKYRLNLLWHEQFITASQAESMVGDCSELAGIIVASITTAKRGIK